MLHNEQETLPNGLTLLWLNLEHVHSAAVVAWVAGGPVCETTRNQGVTHFLEHLHCSSTRDLPDRKSMMTAIDAIPGSIDAGTDPNGVVFSWTTSPEFLGSVIDLMSEMLPARPFPSEIIDSERALLITELASMDGYRFWPFQSLFRNHPYGLTGGGTEKTIRRMTNNVIEDFDRRMFVANRMAVAIAGPLSQELKQQARERFSRIPDGDAISLPRAEPPRLSLPRVMVRTGRTRACSVSIGFLLPAPLSPPARCVMGITHLGLERISSPLFTRLRYENPIAYVFGTDQRRCDGTRVFWIHGTTRRRYRDEFIREVLGELSHAIHDHDPRPWFEPARREYYHAVQPCLDYPAALAHRLAKEVFRPEGEEFLSIEEELRLIRGVSWHEVRTVANEAFASDRVFVCADARLRMFDDRRLKKRVRQWLASAIN